MGCFWSKEDGIERCQQCNRKAVNNLAIVHNVCEICRSPPIARESIQLKARLGQYQCACGRRWESRCAWKNSYQICSSCKRRVFPHELRELRPEDMSKHSDKALEHKKELCQMCIQLGRHCGTRYAKPKPKRQRY